MRLIKCYLESERGIKIGFTEREGKEFFFSPESGIIYKWEKRKLLPNEKILHENVLEAFHISEIRGADVNVAFFPGKQEVFWLEEIFEKAGRDLIGQIKVINKALPIHEGHTESPLGAKIFDDCGVGSEAPPPLPEVGGDLPLTHDYHIDDHPHPFAPQFPPDPEPEKEANLAPQITHSKDRPEGAPDFEGDEKGQESLKKKTKAGGNKRPKK